MPDFTGLFAGLQESIWLAFENIKTWLNNLFSPLIDGVKNTIQNAYDGIVDLLTESEEEKAQKQVELQSAYDNLTSKMNEKLPIIGQAKTALDTVISDNIDYSDTTQQPNITFSYKGQTYKILDLEPFIPYREQIRSYIVPLMYLTFLYKLYRKLPSIIGGFQAL